MNEIVKTIGEGLSLSVIVATLGSLLPPLAALFSICWYSVLLFDRFLKKKKKNEIASD